MRVSLLLASAALAAPFDYFPVPLESNTPQNLLHARYVYPSQGIASADVVDLKMVTNVPSVNLDNIPSIKDVVCEGDIVTITASDDATFNGWDQGLLLLINPTWTTCGPQTTYKVVEKRLVTDRKIEVITSTAKLDEIVESFEIDISSSSTNEKSDKETSHGLQFDWNPGKDYSFPGFANPLGIETVCTDCFVNGNIFVHINVTKTPGSKLPKIKVDLSGQLYSNFDVKIKTGPLDSLVELANDFFKKSFKRIEIPNVAVIDPAFLVGFGFIVPTGPGAQVTYGFDFTIPPFRTTLVGGSDKKEGSESGFNPIFNSHPFKVSPQLPGDQYFKSAVKLVPKMVLDMTLFDNLEYRLGVGIQNFLEGNMRTGTFAPDCAPEEKLITVDAGVRLEAYLDRDVQSLKPWFGKNLINQCLALSS